MPNLLRAQTSLWEICLQHYEKLAAVTDNRSKDPTCALCEIKGSVSTFFTFGKWGQSRRLCGNFGRWFLLYGREPQKKLRSAGSHFNEECHQTKRKCASCENEAISRNSIRANLCFDQQFGMVLCHRCRVWGRNYGFPVYWTKNAGEKTYFHQT